MMKGLRVLTILCACAAVEPATAQVPEPPAAPLATPAPFALPAPPAPPGGAIPAMPQPPQPPQPPQAAQAPQPAPQAPARQPAQTPRTPPTPAPPPTPPVRTVVAPEPAGQLVNIQVDVTIVAESPGEAAVKKVVSLTVADRQSGSVRSNDTRNPGFGDTLNVDVRPLVQRNGQILTSVGLEYANGKQPPVVQLRAQPLLEPGRSLVISRAASPNTDRTVTVEVVARVLK